MSPDFSRELAAFSHFWDSGKYLLHHWRDAAEDVLLDSVIYDIDGGLIVRIEDNQLSYAIKARMREAGVPIVRELPGGKHILEQVAEEFLKSEIENDELAIAYDDL